MVETAEVVDGISNRILAFPPLLMLLAWCLIQIATSEWSEFGLQTMEKKPAIDWRFPKLGQFGLSGVILI